MEELINNHGLMSLFILSFLASTLIPIGSEWLLITLIIESFPVETVVAVATAGNFLGACTTYLVGIYGSEFIIARVIRVDQSNLVRAKAFYKKYGVWSLFFSWLPVVGDALCLVAGVLRLKFLLFSPLVFSGKLARYAFIALVTQGVF
ncbi:YqaA family protein [Thermodesulfobacteriota bacterium]